VGVITDEAQAANSLVRRDKTVARHYCPVRVTEASYLHDRKIKEACLAQKVEDAHTKDWILASYLNQVYFGNHAYGVEAAAQTYFSKHAADLNLVQAALIAGLPQAPSIYDPFQRPAEAVSRRNEVLGAMYSAGDITAEQYQKRGLRAAQAAAGHIYTRIREPYFFSYVREQLIAKYGANTVRGGGSRSTRRSSRASRSSPPEAMQSTLQPQDRPGLGARLHQPEERRHPGDDGRDPGQEEQPVQPGRPGAPPGGSSSRPSCSPRRSEKASTRTRRCTCPRRFHWQPDPSSEAWDVSTFDGSFYGPSSITQSTLRSDNSVYARLTLDLGPEKIVTLAHQMGIKTKLEPVASIGLGSNSVGVLEMASAYATIAAGGIYSEPMAIRKVVLPSGEVDAEPAGAASSRSAVFSDGVAYQVARILKMNVQAGTGSAPTRASRRGQDRDDGRLRRRVVRRDHDDRVHRSSGSATRTRRSDDGGARDPCRRRHLPATIWRLFMVGAFGNNPPADWALPSNPVDLAAVPRPVRVLRAPATSSTVDGHGEGQQRHGHGRPDGRPRRPTAADDD
jgi:hypothetical protein